MQYDTLIDETPSWLDDHEKITCAYIEKRADDVVNLLKDHIEGANVFAWSANRASFLTSVVFATEPIQGYGDNS
ncbi:3-mercaptopyruvate sulfurtransferase SseA [Rhizobium pisi]|uniref:3-mercaptopyruvate sulfurtransferase SseA n=1 Tax=Rhizobium pisi TaxID=574561 RepID=A0A3R9AD29_9HYPH|nr:hypothetical protein [Rhizobium pisi]MBB3137004.1 3-mercaptopyruvate sulfurtransferase SseA [Rhizobium pisi]RSB66823.1 hypothetical protein EFD55_23150 [Rhizobium pisi]TCA50545.1 hypothetical protein E0J16_22190 [Rhizobium pisi]